MQHSVVVTVVHVGSLSLNLCLKWVSGGGIFGRLTLVKGQTLSLLMYIVAAVLCMVGQSMFFIVMQDLATPGMNSHLLLICIIVSFL